MLAAAAAQTLAAAVDDPLRELSRARAQLAGGRAYVLRPRKTVRPGGDLDDPDTLPRVLPAAAADGEVMLLCVGGEGALRTGAGLVLNMRSLGLYHMLLLAPERRVCERMWEAFASVACVWWPSKILHTRRPESLYNTRFNPLALAISDDGGATWAAQRTLEHEDGRQEFSYPTLREDVQRDGIIHVSYTWKRQTIKHSVVSEAWIRGT